MLTKYHRHYHSPYNRALFSFTITAAVMVIGTMGMHYFEGYSYLDSFYLMSMIATAQGLSIIPATPGGKIFVAIMSFVSVGSVVTSLGFLLGPFLGQLWRIGVMHLEEEFHHKKDERS